MASVSLSAGSSEDLASLGLAQPAPRRFMLLCPTRSANKMCHVCPGRDPGFSSDRERFALGWYWVEQEEGGSPSSPWATLWAGARQQQRGADEEASGRRREDRRGRAWG